MPKAEAKPSTSDLIFELATPLLEEALGSHMPPEQAAVTALGRRIRGEVKRIYEVGVASGRAQAATDLRQAVAWYPEAIFPADSDSRSAIAGTAMRHAYEQAAQIAESGHRD